jgi:hypothetical protein
VAVIVTFTIGLVIWICGYAFGIKPFDAFMITILLLVLATAWHIMAPGVKKLLRGQTEL